MNIISRVRLGFVLGLGEKLGVGLGLALGLISFSITERVRSCISAITEAPNLLHKLVYFGQSLLIFHLSMV